VGRDLALRGNLAAGDVPEVSGTGKGHGLDYFVVRVEASRV
jgi:hypothetical protein